MKRLLTIETSSEYCSVAVAIGDQVRERHEHTPLGHAERLLPMVRGLLAEAGLKLRDLDAIAFGRGPGSFTSLRIGIGAVQGLAWGAELPVVPVSSLASVAQQAVEDGATNVLVAMDARMDEVFSARFTLEGGVLRIVGTERVGSPDGVVADRIEDTVGCGNGFERYSALRELGRRLRSVRADLGPRASALIPLAHAWLRTNEPLPPDQAQPLYVRDDVAEKPKAD